MERSCATKYEAVLPVLALFWSIPSFCSQFLSLIVTTRVPTALPLWDVTPLGEALVGAKRLRKTDTDFGIAP
jgi:hypothetical protein